MTFRLAMNALFILFLFLVLFSFAMFQGGFISWFLFYGFLPIFIYHLSLLFYPVHRWQVKRELSSTTVEAGKKVTVNITIKRKIPFPLYYCVFEDIVPNTLNKQDLRQFKYKHMHHPDAIKVHRNHSKIAFPWFKRKFTMSYQLDHLPRGKHVLSKVRIRTGDVFGLIEKEHVFQLVDHLVVFPNKRLIRLHERAEKFEQGSLPSQTLVLNNTNAAAGIREYMPGDQFSWIDWKQTARKKTLMTKEFEQEKSTDTLIVLDCSRHDRINMLAFEATVELAMSLLDSFEQRGTQTGLLTIGDEVAYLPLQQHLKNSQAIERHLAQVQPIGMRPFALKLKEEAISLKGQQFMFLLTIRLEQQLEKTLRQLQVRNKGVKVIFVQAEKNISQSEHAIANRLTKRGIEVIILTEKLLTKDMIEVRRQ